MKVNFNVFIRLLIFLNILTLFSCQKEKLEGEIINDPAFIENLYTNSLDTVIIDNQNLILETVIYRDFFPGGPINNKDRRLFALIWIVNTDSILISQNFIVSKLYIIKNNQVWTSEPRTNPDSFTPEYKSYLISKGGPEWETGIYVDVVISVSDLINSKEKFLIARNQIIEKVE
jgi:hypothetical protein